MLFLGAFLSRTLLLAGISLMIGAVFISPYMQDFLYKFFKVSYLISVKFIVVLIAILAAIFSLQYETAEDLFTAKFVLYQFYTGEDSDKLKRMVDNELKNRKKQEYLVVREDIRTELKYLYNDGQYYEVIIQSVPYINFDANVMKLYEDAKEKFYQERLKTVLVEVPKLVKEEKYLEAHYLAKPFDVKELQEIMVKTKEQTDKNFDKLKLWYKKGKYDKVIKTGEKQTPFDCRIKNLIKESKTAQEGRDKNKKVELEINKVSH
ncbi:hypothetical protein QUF50_08725, partial [Thiotrichales bacterium HSG1]|nr:hypothetical protein [Thiotrichales bacterium HSG1]